MIRGISTQVYEPAEPPRLHFEPVFICDSRLLCTMMLRAWNPEADREMRRGIWREEFPGREVLREADGADVALSEAG